MASASLEGTVLVHLKHCFNTMNLYISQKSSNIVPDSQQQNAICYNSAMSNIAYIDGQNLFMGTTKSANPWKVDLSRFRIYLRDLYQVDRAYYYLGYVQNGETYQ